MLVGVEGAAASSPLSFFSWYRIFPSRTEGRALRIQGFPMCHTQSRTSIPQVRVGLKEEALNLLTTLT